MVAIQVREGAVMRSLQAKNRFQALPAEAYTSDEWFRWEQRRLFGDNWQFGGMAYDIPNPGDRKVVKAGNQLILVVRDEAGELMAYHSRCRHRGMLLDETSAAIPGRITCPYHNWIYGLDGQLVGMPGGKLFEGLDTASIRLEGASVAEWKEMIFIHPDPGAQSFKSWVGRMTEHMGPHPTEVLVEYSEGRLCYELKANWKIFVENYMDGHHLQFLHSETLNMYDHEQQASCFNGPHWSFYEPVTPDYRDWLLSNPNQMLPSLHAGELGAYVHLLFPNLGITETESWWSTIEVVPVAADLTRINIRTRSMPGHQIESPFERVVNRLKGRPDPVIRLDDSSNPLKSGDFMLEDMFVCEQIQKSLSSPGFSIGGLAGNREASLVTFWQTLLAKLNEEDIDCCDAEGTSSATCCSDKEIHP